MKKKNIDTATSNIFESRALVQVGIPCLIVLSYMLLAFQPDLRLAVPEMIRITAGIIALIALAAFLAGSSAVCLSPGVIIATAVLIRIPFLLRTPELSDDIYRYLWDGLQLLAGNNPYSLPPNQAEPVNEASAAIRHLINHGDLVTIYPPAAQVVFAVGAAIGHGVIGLKAVLVALDLATCFVIVRILKTLNLPLWRATLYAWHPLVVLEIAGSGHVDGAGMTFFLLAFMLLVTYAEAPPISSENRSDSTGPVRHLRVIPLMVGILFSVSALVKLYPLIFLPAYLALLAPRDRWLFFAGGATALACLSIPFIPELFNVFTTLGIYTRHWEFSGLAYQTLHAVVSGDKARLLLAALFTAVTIASAVRLFHSTSKWNRHLFLSAVQTMTVTTVAFLILTPTLHPWYALPLVFFLPFAATPSLLILSWAVLLAYKVLMPYSILGQWIEESSTPLMIWIGVAAALLLERINNVRR